MFEKVVAGRADRRFCLGRHGAWASMGAHALIVAGIVVVPPGAPPRVTPEMATMLFLYQAPPVPAPPLLPREARSPARTPGVLRSGALRRAASAREAERPRDAVEPLLRPPPSVAVQNPGNPPALDLSRLRGMGEAGSAADSGASRPGLAGREGAPVVDAEMRVIGILSERDLAEPPRMLNRREIAGVLGRLYPYRFRVHGTQGEVVMMFIIGTDGRAELETVQVISTTNPEFVEPTLKGLARMRFRPAELDGVPVRVRATLPVTWVITES